MCGFFPSLSQRGVGFHLICNVSSASPVSSRLISSRSSIRSDLLLFSWLPALIASNSHHHSAWLRSQRARSLHSHPLDARWPIAFFPCLLSIFRLARLLLLKPNAVAILSRALLHLNSTPPEDSLASTLVQLLRHQATIALASQRTTTSTFANTLTQSSSSQAPSTTTTPASTHHSHEPNHSITHPSSNAVILVDCFQHQICPTTR